MKIVIYSTTTSLTGQKMQHKYFPSTQIQLVKLAERFKNHDFIIATQKPGTFFIDENTFLETDEKNAKQTQKNLKIVLLKEKDASSIAKEIFLLKPDVAIAASFWEEPFDWQNLQDSLIAEKLKESGVRTIACPVKTAALCFDKAKTAIFLEQNNFSHARYFCINHALYTAHKNHTELTSNPYRENVLFKIEKHFKNTSKPLVIKNTTGLSSYGTEVVKTAAEARHFLDSKKNNSDRIIEEYIEGIHFGTEIHGSKGKYKVFEPIMLSVNQYGITSPKQSVKIGPVTNKRYKIKTLKRMLVRLSKKMNFSGIVQVDLIFSNKKWYIIEINPRLSGMTELLAVCSKKTVPEFIECLFTKKSAKKSALNYAAEIKFKILSDQTFCRLSKHPAVKALHQTMNPAARQEREQGYCQVIVGGKKTLKELKKDILLLKKEFINEGEADFFDQALKMIQLIEE